MNLTKSPLNIFNYTSGVQYLMDCLEEKRATNPRISLRSFATKIGLNQSTLSRYFSGERNISSEKAEEIGTKLKLDTNEVHYLKLLFMFGDRGEKALLEKLKASFLYEKNVLDAQGPQGKIFLSNSDLILDLRAYLILEVQNMKVDFTLEEVVELINKYCKTDTEQVSLIVKTLVDHGFLSETSKEKRRELLQKVFFPPGEVPREAGVRFHTDVLDAGKKALAKFDTADMEIFSSIMSIKKENRDKLLAAIKQFNGIIAEFQTTEADDVFLISSFMINMTSDTPASS